MSSIKITKSAEGYLVELLEKQESDTIGVKVFVSDPGSPRAETCIAYCKNDDDINEYEIREDLSFKLYLEKKSLSFIEDEDDTEMMWYYLDKVTNLKKVVLPNHNKKPNKVRLTLDYEEDYWLLESVRRIVGNLADRAKIEQLFLTNPDLYKVNWFRNEEWKQMQLSKKV